MTRQIIITIPDDWYLNMAIDRITGALPDGYEIEVKGDN